MVDVFKCYSKTFRNFLCDHGLRYLIVAVDVVNGKTFWLFERDEKFKELADQWRLTNPNRGIGL